MVLRAEGREMEKVAYSLLLTILIALQAYPRSAYGTVLCPPTYTPETDWCFKLMPGLSLSFADARTACSQDGGRLLVEVTADEHAALVRYRLSLPGPVDPFWVGVHVVKQGQWSFLSDPAFATHTGPLFQHWRSGSMPMANIGSCAMASEENSDLLWEDVDCTLLLSVICETNPLSTPAPTATTTATTTTTPSPTGALTTGPVSIVQPDTHDCHQWRKLFPNSKYTQSVHIHTNSTLSSLHSVSYCAIWCSNTPDCAGFNHRRVDNNCELIMTEVQGAYVSGTTGWDVWKEI